MGPKILNWAWKPTECQLTSYCIKHHETERTTLFYKGSTPRTDVKKPAGLGRVFSALAETEGFEPSMRLYTPYSLSRGAPSATRSRFQSRYYASFWRGSRQGRPSPNHAVLPKTMGGLQEDFVQTTRRSASKAQGDTPHKRTNTRNTLTTRRTQTSPRVSANPA